MHFEPPQDLSAFRIDHAAVLHLDHSRLDASGMFRMAALLDGFELRSDPFLAGHKLKHSFTIDVLEMEPERTTIKITPRRKLTYEGLTKRVDSMLGFLRRKLQDDHLVLARLSWEIRQTGIPSDERETLRRIK